MSIQVDPVAVAALMKVVEARGVSRTAAGGGQGVDRPAAGLERGRGGRFSGAADEAGARGMTYGYISAHLADVYGSEVSKATISTITDKVLDGLAKWQHRPLDAVYPVVFIDAIHVKVRDGQVANRPIYVAAAVTAEGNRDTLGLLPESRGRERRERTRKGNTA